jgi:hypothetical protein
MRNLFDLRIRQVGRKSDSAFRQRSVHTAEGAGKKPPAFPPYVPGVR